VGDSGLFGDGDVEIVFADKNEARSESGARRYIGKRVAAQHAARLQGRGKRCGVEPGRRVKRTPYNKVPLHELHFGGFVG